MCQNYKKKYINSNNNQTFNYYLKEFSYFFLSETFKKPPVFKHTYNFYSYE